MFILLLSISPSVLVQDVRQQTNETSQLSRDTNRDLGSVEERMDRVERQQRRTNSRLNDLEDRD